MRKSTQASSRRFRDLACAALFLECYEQLPKHTQKLADKNFALFNKNPGHPSLGFRKKGGVYTAEIGRRYRALARERKGDYTHEDYNNLRL